MQQSPHNGDLTGIREPLETLARRETPWQSVSILRHPVYGAQLVIDRDLQISESDFAYNTAMAAPVLKLQQCREVAILGGGDGGVMRELQVASERLNNTPPRVTLVDIDGEVLKLCERHMPGLCGNAFSHPRANVSVGDAFAWIAGARDLDAVIYDLTMEPVRQDINRREFIGDILSKIHDALRPAGVISMQACGELEPDRDILLADIRTALDARFDAREEQTVMIPSYGERWTFMAARKT